MHVDVCDSVRVSLDPKPIANVIVFGGLRPQGGYVVPAFEFVKSFTDLRFNVIFIRDLSQRWFNFGIKGFSLDMADTAEQLRYQIDTRFDRSLPLYTVGNSAGGYGAIYFGEVLGADTVLAMVPQTMIDLNVLARFGHAGWEQMGKFQAIVPNLRAVMTGKAARVHIVVGKHSPEDVIHAGNLAGCENVYIEIMDGKHDVGRRWQKEEGGLARKIADRLIPRQRIGSENLDFK